MSLSRAWRYSVIAQAFVPVQERRELALAWSSQPPLAVKLDEAAVRLLVVPLENVVERLEVELVGVGIERLPPRVLGRRRGTRNTQVHERIDQEGAAVHPVGLLYRSLPLLGHLVVLLFRPQLGPPGIGEIRQCQIALGQLRVDGGRRLELALGIVVSLLVPIRQRDVVVRRRVERVPLRARLQLLEAERELDALGLEGWGAEREEDDHGHTETPGHRTSGLESDGHMGSEARTGVVRGTRVRVAERTGMEMGTARRCAE
jgi:hypothetical protein